MGNDGESRLASSLPARFMELGGTKELAVVDEEDFEACWEYNWRLKRDKKTGKEYARACFRKNGLRVCLYLHRYIMGCRPGDGRYVDHINGDGLDCTRANLRMATAQQNAVNVRASGAIKYKGVRRWRKRFRAAITVMGEKREIGSFDSAEAAARAYDREAIKAWGDFAHLNFRELAQKTTGYTIDPESEEENER